MSHSDFFDPVDASIRFTISVLSRPCAACIRPLGSNPSVRTCTQKFEQPTFRRAFDRARTHQLESLLQRQRTIPFCDTWRRLHASDRNVQTRRVEHNQAHLSLDPHTSDFEGSPIRNVAWRQSGPQTHFPHISTRASSTELARRPSNEASADRIGSGSGRNRRPTESGHSVSLCVRVEASADRIGSGSARNRRPTESGHSVSLCVRVEASADRIGSGSGRCVPG